ncbi:MAG: VWA domain-containing protein, partial [Candidatus Sericytochromatia bacterium]
IGATLLSYKEPGEDGYFMLLASPKVEWAENATQARQLTFVVDTSGSMSGEKIQQARDALVFNLNQLDARDMFHVLTFSDTLNPLTQAPVKASSKDVSSAISFARKLEAGGGTNINDALLEAMRSKAGDGVPMLLFLTDGDPTVGVTDFNEILKNVRGANQRDVRLFVFGVGYDVNIPFLDKLAKENHGSAEFVRPEESIETKISRLFSQISHPILTSPKVSWGSVATHDVLPSQMPDVFKGSQLVAVGRYRSGGNQTVTLSGMVNGKPQSYSFPNQSFASGQTQYNFLPRIWASRRIGQLMDQIRLKGQNAELVTEVIRLSKQYGIITEYTSFLVRDEVDVRSNADAAPMMQQAQEQVSRSLENADKGAWAVSQSQNATNMQKQAAPAPAGGGSYLDAEGQVQTVTEVKYVAQRAFYFKNGIWQDSLPADKLPVVSIQRYSQIYFELAQRKDIKDILALGASVEFVLQGNLVKIGEKGQQQLTPALKKQLGL